MINKDLLKVGDRITCKDADECIEIMRDLLNQGIDADFCYNDDGKKGLWLEVTKIER